MAKDKVSTTDTGKKSIDDLLAEAEGELANKRDALTQIVTDRATYERETSQLVRLAQIKAEAALIDAQIAQEQSVSDSGASSDMLKTAEAAMEAASAQVEAQAESSKALADAQEAEANRKEAERVEAQRLADEAGERQRLESLQVPTTDTTKEQV